MSEMSSIIYAAIVKLNTLDAYLIQDHKYNIAALSFRELKWMPNLEECKSHANLGKLYNDSAFRLPNQTKYLTAWCDLVNAAQSKNKLNKNIIVIDSLSEYNALNCNPEKQKSYSFEECGISVDMVSLKKKFYKQKDPYMKVSPLINCLINRLPKKD
jgi:hypothetical protein